MHLHSYFTFNDEKKSTLRRKHRLIEFTSEPCRPDMWRLNVVLYDLETRNIITAGGNRQLGGFTLRQ